MTRRPNLAARMAHWSGQHRKKAFFGWLAFVILAFAIGQASGSKQISDVDQFTGESHDAEAALDRAGLRPLRGRVHPERQAHHQGRRVPGSGPGRDAAPAEGSVRGERAVAARQATAPSLRTAMRRWSTSTSPATRPRRRIGSMPVLAAVARIQTRHPNLTVEQFGDASANKAVNETISEDLKSAGDALDPGHADHPHHHLRHPRGGERAAADRDHLGDRGARPRRRSRARILPVDDNLPAVILLIGLAVGVDYSLFYLKREREERARGRSETAALEAAAATSGRAVLISGATVIVAMAGMLISGDKAFISFAEGTILVVAMAMFASLTVLPAMLSWLGDRVEKGRVPFLGRRRGPAGESRFWSVADRSGHAASRHVAGARGRAAGGARDSGARHEERDERHRRAAAGPPGDRHLQQGQGGLPAGGRDGHRGGRGRRRARRRRWPPASTACVDAVNGSEVLQEGHRGRSRARTAPSRRSTSRRSGTAPTRRQSMR